MLAAVGLVGVGGTEGAVTGPGSSENDATDPDTLPRGDSGPPFRAVGEGVTRMAQYAVRQALTGTSNYERQRGQHATGSKRTLERTRRRCDLDAHDPLTREAHARHRPLTRTRPSLDKRKRRGMVRAGEPTLVRVEQRRACGT